VRERERGPFMSVEDLKERTRISSAVIELLRTHRGRLRISLNLLDFLANRRGVNQHRHRVEAVAAHGD